MKLRSMVGVNSCATFAQSLCVCVCVCEKIFHTWHNAKMLFVYQNIYGSVPSHYIHIFIVYQVSIIHQPIERFGQNVAHEKISQENKSLATDNNYADTRCVYHLIGAYNALDCVIVYSFRLLKRQASARHPYIRARGSERETSFCPEVETLSCQWSI